MYNIDKNCRNFKIQNIYQYVYNVKQMYRYISVHYYSNSVEIGLDRLTINVCLFHDITSNVFLFLQDLSCLRKYSVPNIAGCL